MSSAQAEPKQTLVDWGTSLEGNLKSDCPIVVMGKIEGDVSGPSLEVTPTGLVRGHVKVTDLRSHGELAGQVDAETVQLGGRVRDNTVIRAQSLEVSTSDTPVVFGECELSIGDLPERKATTAQSQPNDAAQANARRRGNKRPPTPAVPTDPAEKSQP